MGLPRQRYSLYPFRLRWEAAAVRSLVRTRPAYQGFGWGVVGVDRERTLQQIDGLGDALVGVSVAQRQRAQIKVIGVEALGWLAGCALDLGLAQFRFDGTGDPTRHLVLQLEDVVEHTVKAVGPDMRAGRRVYQLAGDANPVAGFAQAAFEHIAHAELTADLAQIGRLALVGKARIAGDDEEPRQPPRSQ